MAIKVLILDLDDTLIDNRDHVLEATRLTLEAHGHNFTIEDLEKHKKLHGNIHKFRRTLIDDDTFYQGEKNVLAFRPRIEESIAMEFVKEIQDARKFLKKAKKLGFKIVIVTSSDWYETDAKLRLLKTNVKEIEEGNSIIGAVVASDGSDLRKPHIQPAITALQKIGIKNYSDCEIIFIGDSDADMNCGINLRKEGYKVTNILMNHYHSNYNSDVEGADIKVKSFKELLKKIS